MVTQSTDRASVPPEECDIVMRGGITSGVVYPSAVRRLAERYRFRGIGGASVGAIAAAVTAAAEYGRRTGQGTGFAELDAIDAEIGEEGRLLSLFRPHPEARGLYGVYLAAIGGRGPLRVVTAAVGQARWTLVLLAAWIATVGLILARAGSVWLPGVVLAAWGAVLAVVMCSIAREIRPRLILGGFVAPIIWPLALAFPAIGITGWRDLSRLGFGLVPGASADSDGLCDWLHRHIQAAAGLPEDQPLTFGMLAEGPAVDGEPVGIRLEMMTTNLSTARPVRLPRDLVDYHFHPADLADQLPAPVLRWLEERGRPAGELVRMPDEDDIPVLLAFRMSLSFPVLFTAVKLHGPAPETGRSTPVPHWFSDGGIGSNFPIHFFDAWMPRRPTFALSFAPVPVGPNGQPVDDEDIGLPPEPNDPRLPRWVPVTSIGGFFAQVLDTMQNWRDTLQSELPGFRDRVYEARLDRARGEGGLNLAMDAETIARLQDRGGRVGEAIVGTFDMDQHFLTRYLVTMQQLEFGLVGGGLPGARRRTGVQAAFAARRAGFAQGDVGAHELFGRPPAWLPGAGAATWELIDRADSWCDGFGGYIGGAPIPIPVMRVVPDI